MTTAYARSERDPVVEEMDEAPPSRPASPASARVSRPMIETASPSPSRLRIGMRRARFGLKLLGLDLEQASRVAADVPRFLRDAATYRRAWMGGRFPLELRALMPALGERSASAGIAKGAYFHQDLWAARKVFARRPARHVDVGSRIDGFVAHLLVFMPVEVIDIRSLEASVRGLAFLQEDATTLARFAPGSLPSISSLHAVEHFGLGRYGDPVSPEGWRLGMLALARVLAPGGRLYFSVPIGRERLRFNAHRIFSPKTVLETFSDLRLASFSAVDEAGDLVEDAEPGRFSGAHHVMGLFEFTR